MSWYRTGTVAVTNGSKTVTGTGTLWASAVNAGDAFALVDANLNPTGAWYEVESVTNNTTLVLKQSYAGTTGSNKTYCVFNLVGNMTTPSFAQRLAQFFDSFQGLIDKPTTTPTASSIPIADSGGKIADGWIPATVARLASPTLTGTPTAPTVTGSDSSTKIATTSHVKSALSTIGVGTTAMMATSTDWNDLPIEFPTSGIFGFSVDAVSTTATNRPATGWFYVMHLMLSTSVTQIAFPYRVGFAKTECIWIRNRYNNVWTPWRMVYDQYNILGTVSQVGGVPTGAVIERGSNSNGEYVKFADGTVICTQTISSTGMNITEGNVLYNLGTWTLPVSTTFSNKMFINASARNTALDKPLYTAVSHSAGVALLWNTGKSQLNVTPGAAIRGIGSFSDEANTMTVQLLAIGRWF